MHEKKCDKSGKPMKPAQKPIKETHKPMHKPKGGKK